MFTNMLGNVKDALLDSGFHKQLAQKVVLAAVQAVVVTTIGAVATVVIKDIQQAIEDNKAIEMIEESPVVE